MRLNAAALQARIDTLLRADDFGLSRWPFGTSAAPAQLTYQFERYAPADFPFTDVAAPGPFRDDQTQAIRDALSLYQAFLNVEFVETTGVANADLSFYRSPDIFVSQPYFGTGIAAFDTLNLHDAQSAAWDGHVVYLDVLDLTAEANAFLLVHEIGHALGLKHPGFYNETGTELPVQPLLPSAEDTQRFSIMSFIADPDLAQTPGTPMLYDVAALQAWWGVNPTQNAGATRHDPFQTEALKVISDVSGRDEIRYEGAEDVAIHLTPGRFFTKSGEDIAVIAYGTVIEAATGDAGNDVLAGNAFANHLIGGDGADDLRGLRGADRLAGGNQEDRLLGGRGHDWLGGQRDADLLAGGRGNDHLSGGRGNDLLHAGRGSDTLLGGPGSDQLTGGRGDDTLWGGGGADHLTGGWGADTLWGGDGADRLTGGRGTDTLWGGEGTDRLTGGPGADTFLFALGDGADLVRDFDPDRDRIALSSDLLDNPSLTVEQILRDHIASDGGDLLISFGPDVLRLQGLADTVLQVATLSVIDPF